MKIIQIDLCKGLAIILVILGHSFILYPINLMEISWCESLNSIISSFHLATFFFISGFLFSISIKKGYFEILKSKCYRLLIPYFAFSIVNFFIKICFPSLMNRKIDNLEEYINNLLLFGGELWFVYSLFTMFIIWGGILSFINRKYVIFLIVLLYVLDSLYPRLENNILLNGKFIHFSIFFLSGYLTLPKHFEIFKNKTVLIISISLFILFSISKLLFIFPMYIYLVYTFIGIIFVFSICYAIKPCILHKILGFFGKYSLQFYIFNGFVLVPSRFLLCNLLNIENSLAIVSGVFIICIIGEIFIIEFLRKIKLARYLFSIPK